MPLCRCASLDEWWEPGGIALHLGDPGEPQNRNLDRDFTRPKVGIRTSERERERKRREEKRREEKRRDETRRDETRRDEKRREEKRGDKRKWRREKMREIMLT